MILKKNSEQAAIDTVQALLSLQAVHVYQHTPFIYTTGWASPVYVDCRKLMSHPEWRRRAMDQAAELIRGALGDAIDVVAGTESAGIPFAAWIAERLERPMVYVRKKAVGWGSQAQIEGEFKPGARCLLVDDLTTDGLSKLGAAHALRKAGADLRDIFVLFNYDIYPQSHAAFASNDIRMHALATWRDVFAATKSVNYFSPEQAREIKSFITDPVGWSINHGGAGKLTATIAGEQS